MYGTLSGAMMAATRTETTRRDAPRPARLPQTKTRQGLVSRLKTALIARRAAH